MIEIESDIYGNILVDESQIFTVRPEHHKGSDVFQLKFKDGTTVGITKKGYEAIAFFFESRRII